MISIRPESRRFALWAGAVLVVLLPLWWLWGADLAAIALRPFAAIVLGLTGVKDVIALDTGWLIQTSLPLASGQGDYNAEVSQNAVRRLLLGFPLLIAFMVVPPRTERPIRSALIGLAALSVVFVLSMTAFVWGELAVALNPALGISGAGGTPALAAEPLHPAVAQLVLLGRYAGMSILPLITAILVWAATNPAGLRSLYRPA